MKDLESRVERLFNKKSVWLEKIYSAKDGEYHFSGNFYRLHLMLGITSLLSEELNKAKNNFNVCSLIDFSKVEKYNDRLLDYGLPNICYVLQDNGLMIKP